LVTHVGSNAIFIPGRDSGANRFRERLQLRSGDPAVAGIKRDDRGVDAREELSAHRSACYIATRARFSSILQRGHPLPRVPANRRFLDRITLSYSLLHSPATSPDPCSTPGASTIEQR
jgi:hypothetical protein